MVPQNRSGFKSATSDLHVIRGVPQQTTEGDGVCYSAQVNKQNGRQGLDVECVREVTEEEGHFPLDVEYETATKPKKARKGGY